MKRADSRRLGRAGLVAALLLLASACAEEPPQPWLECPLDHPGGEPRVALLQRPLHPFLAEYEYRIRFGREEQAVERWLPMNVGGRTRMNVYWYPAGDGGGAYLRLADRWGEYALDLEQRRTLLLLRYRDRVFAGEVLESFPGGGVGRSGPAGGPYEIHASVGGRPAAEVTQSPLGSGRGRYIGRIQDATFLPEELAPEVAIEGPASRADALDEALRLWQAKEGRAD